QLMLGDGYDEHGEPTGIEGRILFPVSLFDEPTVATLARRFERLLAELASEPVVPVGDLDWLTEDERAEVVELRNATGHQLDPEATLVSLCALGSRIDPRATAIVDGALTDRRTEISYADFDARVHRLARHLISLGVGPGGPVGVAPPRGAGRRAALHAAPPPGGRSRPLAP